MNRSLAWHGGQLDEFPRLVSLGSAAVDASASAGRRNDCAFRDHIGRVAALLNERKELTGGQGRRNSPIYEGTR
jgi:hypothetical protein